MKNKKIIIFLITFTIVIMLLCSTVFAMHPGEVLIDGPDKIEGSDELISFGGRVLSFIQIIGSIASVLILMALGIKYMLGSVEEKAGYKKSMIPFLIGAVMLFSVSTVPSIVYEFVGGEQTISMKKAYMYFCPNGHPAEIHFISVEWNDSDVENAYLCTKKNCIFYDRELYEAQITRGYGCPRCKIKLDGNYCNSCKKYYE